MAIYNSASYLDDSVESVLCQSYSNWELIIIDDGSSDNHEIILQKYPDKRIKYFYREHQGVSSARNAGLRKMKGEFFCFLDADDQLPQNSLLNRLNIFNRDNSIVFVDGLVKIYDKNLEKLRSTWKPSFKGNPLSELLSISEKCFFGQSWMIRRDITKKYQFEENLTHGEDLLFYIVMALEGGVYDYTESEVLHYRKGHASAMTDLKGLEVGYHYIFKTISHFNEISPNQLGIFKQNARKIIFKSYFGNFQMINAILSLLRKWQKNK
jgi:glycosyltransferase involved in cell wall biosynthesis